MKTSKKLICLTVMLVLSFVSMPFAQAELHEAIDAGDVATAQKMVKKGEVEEIYCGKLSPEDAVKVYEKIFKSMPTESFGQCPVQFSYGYGQKVCSNAKAMNACLEVVSYLLMDAVTGSTNAIETLGKVVQPALKTKAFAKPVREQVDTTTWVACPKKGKEKNAKFDESCVEECKANADSLGDTLRLANCESNPEHFIETTIAVSMPSPLYTKLSAGLQEAFWKSPMSVAANFAELIRGNAKALSIADTLVPGVQYVARWAESHKANSTPLPGGELFRFCAAWQPQVDSILAGLELDTRCPVFKTFTDTRDNKTYKVKEIGGVDWFVQNLDFAVEEGSLCYDREDDNCKAFGRLYTQAAAREACPEGSHLSTDAEWKALEELAGGAASAAEKLRSNGSDEFAFTALFGGYANKSGISTIVGEGAYFWTEAVSPDSRGVARSMFSTDKDVSSITVDGSFFLSVRCVVDGEEQK